MKMLRQIVGFSRFTLKEAAGRTWLVLLLLLIGSCLESLSLLMTIPLLHMISGSQGVGSAFPSFMPPITLGPLLGAIVLLLLSQSLIARRRIVLMTQTMHSAIDALRMRLFTAIGQGRWSRIAAMRGSDLNHALTADMDRVQLGIFNLMSLGQNIILLAIYGLLSALVSWQMTLFALVVGTAIVAALYPMRRRTARHAQFMAAALRERQHVTSEFIAGMKLARAFNNEASYLGRLDQLLTALRGETVRFARLAANSSIAFQIASSVAGALFIYVAYAYVVLPLPQIVTMLLLFMRLAPRFNAVQETLQQLILTMPAYEHVRQLMERFAADAADEERGGGERVPLLQREIRFEHVCVRHEGQQQDALADLDITLPAGRMTALVGPSGAGKSSIADVLMGLLHPRAGRLLVDGVAIGPGNRRQWRDQIAYVPQDVFLLHDTIAANLRIARAGASEAQIWAALEAANAKSFVEALPSGLETVLGDRGSRLSGGERQRIALARALLRQPRLLVLDEATSALDWNAQSMIRQSIEELRGRMTILAIAHSSSLIAAADHLVHIEQGRVVNAGSAEEHRRQGNEWVRLAIAQN